MLSSPDSSEQLLLANGHIPQRATLISSSSACVARRTLPTSVVRAMLRQRRRFDLLAAVVVVVVFASAAVDAATVRIRAPAGFNETTRFRIRRVRPGGETDSAAPSTDFNVDVRAPEDAPPPQISAICGYSAIKLIQSRQDAQPGEFPWIGALFINRDGQKLYLCTVNLVTSKHLLTAAHCMILSPKPESYNVVLGYLMPEPHVRMPLASITVHPLYDKRPEHDLAILMLADALRLSATLRPICIRKPVAAERETGYGTVAGFGPDYTTYRKVGMPLVARERCHDSNELFRALATENTFCAGDRNTEGPCNGDSGAGYMQDVDGRLYIRGVVSTSLQKNGTCNLRAYVLFADLFTDIGWVNDVLRDFLQ